MASEGSASARLDVIENASDFEQVNSDRQEHHSHKKYKLNADESRVLRECNRESFYYRSLPLSVAGMIAVQYAVKAGRLKSHPRWGSALKVMIAGAAGYMIGKISYQRKCIQKLMQLPNSPLAEALRKQSQKMHPVTDKLGFDPIFGGPTSDGKSVDVDNTGTWEIDVDKNVEFQGLDDSQRPTVDNPVAVVEDDKPRSFGTYDEMRQKNREEYQNKRQEFQQRQAEFSARLTQNKGPAQVPQSQSNLKKNMYGDVME